VIGNTNHLILLGLAVPSRSGFVDDELEGEDDADDIVSPAVPSAPVAVAPQPVNA
jgi:hypothetical protein